MERDKGIEPSSQPWEGRILPLYESRKLAIAYHFFKKIPIVFLLKLC